jgi:hypothetical protein
MNKTITKIRLPIGGDIMRSAHRHPRVMRAPVRTARYALSWHSASASTDVSGASSARNSSNCRDRTWHKSSRRRNIGTQTAHQPDGHNTDEQFGVRGQQSLYAKPGYAAADFAPIVQADPPNLVSLSVSKGQHSAPVIAFASNTDQLRSSDAGTTHLDMNQFSGLWRKSISRGHAARRKRSAVVGNQCRSHRRRCRRAACQSQSMRPLR